MTDTHSRQSEERSTTTGHSSADQPPGPRGLPLLGSTLSIGRDPLGFVESARAYGDVVAYEAYGDDAALVFDPHAVETVLVSRAGDVRKGAFETEFGELIAPEGVAFTEGERWRRQRQLLQSSFTPNRVHGYADDMVGEARVLVEGWEDGETVALRDAMARYTLRVLTRTLFDLPFEDDRADVVRRAVEAIQRYASPRRLAIESLLPSWFPDRVEREYEASMAALESLVDDLVETRREADASGDDLLSVLASAQYPDGSRPSPDEVRDQLVTFLFAGHETTATALSVACWLVAGSPDVRGDLERELEAVCGDGPGVADLDDLAYTEAVAREAMRLYPPVIGVYREPKTDMILSGYHVPAGTTLQLSVYGIQRDSRWWDDPGTFRPERWLTGGGSNEDESNGGDSNGGWTLEDAPDRPEYAYFPFGGGPRHCLGMRFAMTELTLALATIVSEVEFEHVTASLEPSVGVTLDPGPLEVRVRRR